MPSIDQITAKITKEYGAGFAERGRQLPEMERLPSGIFNFDLATGGGIPRNKLTIMYGNESANKTNICLSLVREHQRLYPKQTCVYVDVEHGLEKKWASRFVNWDEMLHVEPEYAEQAVDMVCQYAAGDDCGLLVIDSIAAMSSMVELEDSAEKAQVATNAKPVSKLVRKLTSILAEAARKNSYESVPTIVWVNQRRVMIGGNSKYTQFGFPGGDNQRFMASMIIRLYGKNKMDEAVHKAIPARKEVTGVIQKWKCPVFSVDFNFEMAMIPHLNTPVGQCPDDWKDIKNLLEAYELMEKVDGGVLYNGEKYATQKALWEYLRQDDHLLMLEKSLLQTTLGEPINSDPDTILKGA